MQTVNDLDGLYFYDQIVMDNRRSSSVQVPSIPKLNLNIVINRDKIVSNLKDKGNLKEKLNKKACPDRHL